MLSPAAAKVRRTYLLLTVLIWLPTALVFGVNTLFLLDGGLSNAEAFAANAFYTLGLLVFELPTGVVADTWGRRRSFLLGTVTQLVGNALYVTMWGIDGPFVGWIAASVILGGGYTFFSGALEAWLVDALADSGYDGPLDPIFGRAQVVSGVAMLVGSVGGGVIAQVSNLGMPYVVRCVIQVGAFVLAFALMHDLGWTPEERTRLTTQLRHLGRCALEYGVRQRPVRWVMFAGPFAAGTGIYAFYAAQPYLLELYGEKESTAIAGLAAAIISGTQIVGGLLVPALRHVFARRTHILLAASALGAGSLVLIGVTRSFPLALVLLMLWALGFAATMPVRQAYVNGLIPSQQRATLLSFDSMVSSTGGVVFQPALGRVADVRGYASSYVVTGAIAALGIPFTLLARRENAASDRIDRAG